MKKGTNLLEGSIWKGIVSFAIPLFLGNLFQQLYNTADSLIVGNFLGSDALAAVSSSGSLIFLMVGFFNGIAVGAGVVISKYFGAADYDGLKKAVHTNIASGVRLYPDSGRNDIGTPDSCIDGNAGVGAAKLHCIFQGIFCGIGRICHV